MASSLIHPFHRRSAGRFLGEKQEAIDSFVQFVRGGNPPRYPLEIFLEVSNVCDLQCVMCPRFSSFNQARKQAVWDVDPGFLDPDSTTASLGPLLEHALLVHAFGYGEPTIHPSFADFLQHLAQYEVMIRFFTNGMHLTDSLVRQLVDLSVHQITVSLSGSNRNDYESVYQGGDYDRVIDGLARLRDAKKAARSRYPIVTINSLTFEHHVRTLDVFVEQMAGLGVARIGLNRLLEHSNFFPTMKGHEASMRSPETHSAIDAAFAAAARHGVELEVHAVLGEEFSKPMIEAADLPDRVPVGKFREIAGSLPVLPRAAGEEPAIPVIDIDHERYPEIRRRMGVQPVPAPPDSRRFYCLEPFKTFYLRRGGQVKTCCNMRDDAIAVGDIRRWTGEQIWNGSAYETARSAILNGQYPWFGCSSCLQARLAPASHGLQRIVPEYAAWHPSARGYPFDDATVRELEIDGASIVDRLFDRGVDATAAPDAGERVTSVLALVRDVSELDASWSAVLEGFVDRSTAEGFSGWLWSPLFSDLRLPVELWVGNEKRLAGVASQYRPDLAAAGKGDGRFGFTLGTRLSDSEIRAARVRIAGTSCALRNS